MSGSELGGDAPCWAHLLHDDTDPAHGTLDTEAADGALDTDGHGLVVDLGSAATGSGGAIWSLPHGGDLDANLIRLDPNAAIGDHINNDVDVLVIVQSGTGEITVNETTRQVGCDHLALIPRTASRSFRAGPVGITYLSVHRRRSPLTVTKPAGAKTSESMPHD